MKEVSRRISFPMYSYTLIIVITDDVGASRIKRNKLIDGNYKDKPGTVALHSKGKAINTSYIFCRPDQLGSLVHESFHAVWAIMEAIGADHEEEIFAYTQTYIFEEGMKVIEAWKKKFE